MWYYGGIPAENHHSAGGLVDNNFKTNINKTQLGKDGFGHQDFDVQHTIQKHICSMLGQCESSYTNISNGIFYGEDKWKHTLHNHEKVNPQVEYIQQLGKDIHYHQF